MGGNPITFVVGAIKNPRTMFDQLSDFLNAYLGLSPDARLNLVFMGGATLRFPGPFDIEPAKTPKEG